MEHSIVQPANTTIPWYKDAEVKCLIKDALALDTVNQFAKLLSIVVTD